MNPCDMLLVTIGSSGDVNPFLAFGVELQRRGHAVTVMTNGHFEPVVRQAGLAFVEEGTAESYDQTIRHADIWHPTRSLACMVDFGMVGPMRSVYKAIESRAAVSKRLRVVHSTLAVGARVAQERLGVATTTVHLSPSVFRSTYRNALTPGLWMPRPLPRGLKRAIYRAADWLVADRLLTRPVNAFRSELGLTPVKHLLDGWLHSPSLTLGAWPAWFAGPQPDWPASLRLTGFPLFDGSVTPRLGQDLVGFLSHEQRPIVFTCGSAMVQGRDFFDTSARACRLLGHRGILLTRYGDQVPAGLGPLVVHCPYAPLNQLLKSAAALVHHGGVGTMAAALGAGVPQLIVPMAFDQRDNAVRLVEHGLGRSIRRRAYTARRAAVELSRLLDPHAYRPACQEAAEKINDRAGVIAACDAIEGIGV